MKWKAYLAIRERGAWGECERAEAASSLGSSGKMGVFLLCCQRMGKGGQKSGLYAMASSMQLSLRKYGCNFHFLYDLKRAAPVSTHVILSFPVQVAFVVIVSCVAVLMNES